jgi:hypothetical protein
MQTFRGMKPFLLQALAAWGGRAEAEQARREADTRTDEQRRREREEEDRRRRLADRRAALSDEVLRALRHRAEEALAAAGVACTRLGYDVLVKLKVDELLDREDLPAAGGDDRTPAERAVVACREAESVPGDGDGPTAR